MCSRSPAGARDLGGLECWVSFFGGLMVMFGGSAIDGPMVAIPRELDI